MATYTRAAKPVIDVADQPDLKLLGQKLRRAPIEMQVNASLSMIQSR
jgi:hypothetical protein